MQDYAQPAALLENIGTRQPPGDNRRPVLLGQIQLPLNAARPTADFQNLSSSADELQTARVGSCGDWREGRHVARRKGVGSGQAAINLCVEN